MLTGRQKPNILKHDIAIKEIQSFLVANSVNSIYAYNASFDVRCLSELSSFKWHDIVRIAAYRQHNPAIPETTECCRTGRIKSGYRVEDILNMFGECDYHEVHNALIDAIDELRIMKYLMHPIRNYPVLTV